MDLLNSILSKSSDNSNVLKELEKQEKLLQDSTESSSDDDIDSESDTYSSKEEDTYNIELSIEKRNVFMIDDHIDPNTLACKDSLRHMHLLNVSRNLPTAYSEQSSFGFSQTSNKSKYANSKWATLGGKDPLYYNIKNVIYPLNIHHHVFGLRGSSQRKTWGVLANEAIENDPQLLNSVIRGLPVKSPLFVYNLTISRKKNPGPWDNPSGFNAWDCESCILHKKPLDKSNIHYFTFSCIGLLQDESDKFEAALGELYPQFNTGSSIEITYRDYEKIMAEIGLYNSKRPHDREVPELIRYIYCDEVCELTKYYNEKIVLNMKPAMLVSLYNAITQDPFQLFIFKMSPFKFRINKKLKRKKNKDDSATSTTEIATEAAIDDSLDDIAWNDDEDADIEMSEKLEQLTLNKDIVHISYFNYPLSAEVFWLFLPELDMTHFRLLETEKVTLEQRDIVRMYNAAKEIQAEYHSCIEEFQLTLSLQEDPLSELSLNDRTERALKWLTTTPLRNTNSNQGYSGYIHTPLKEHNGKYYLRQSHLNTMAIKECFEVLTDRYIKHKSMDVDEKERIKSLVETLGPAADIILQTDLIEYVEEVQMDINSVSKTTLNKLYSDQQLGLYMTRDAPYILLCGRAGVGKTFLLHVIMSTLKVGEVIACAFQGRNVAALSKVFGGWAYTLHMLIYMHKKACATESWCTSNIFRRPTTNGLTKDINAEKECNGIKYHRCPFENVKVLVIDEMSLMNDELFSIVLSIFIKCGKLSKLIICGDPHQLPPIGIGQTLKELKKFLDQLGLTVELTQCQRQSNDARLIFDNCTAIINKQPEKVIWDQKVFIHEYFTHPYSDGGSYEYGEKALEIIKNPEYGFTHYNHFVLSYMRVVRDSINPVLMKYFCEQHIDPKNYRKDSTIIHKGAVVSSKRNYYIEGNTITTNERGYVREIQDCDISTVTEKEGDNNADTGDDDPKNKKKKKPTDIGKALCSKDLKKVEVPNSKAKSSFPNSKRRLEFVSLDHYADGSVKYIPYVGPYKKKIQTVYAQTIHGALGGEESKVLVVDPFSCRHFTNEGIYTAISRAIDMFIYAGCLRQFESVVKRSEKERQTDLAGLLIKEVSSRIPGGWNNWMKPNGYEELKYLENNMDVCEEFTMTELTTVTEMKDRIGVTIEKTSPLWIVARVLLKQSFSNLKTIYRLKRVSKEIKSMLESDEMWRDIYRALYLTTDVLFAKGFKRVSRIQNLISENRKAAIREIINSIGKTIYVCKSGSCNRYQISSLSIISQYLEKTPNISPKQSLNNPEIYLTTINQRVCGCSKVNCTFIFIKEGDQFTPVTATIAKSEGYYKIDTSGLANEHPDVLETFRIQKKRIRTLESVKKEVKQTKKQKGDNVYTPRECEFDFW